MLFKSTFKVFLILSVYSLIFVFSNVYAETYTNYNPNRYYGYFETLTLDSDNILECYYDNGSVEDDQYSSLQVLSSGSTNNYRIQVATYMPSVENYCPPSSLACNSYDFNNNYTEIRFFEQDICVSSNNLSFKIVNGGTDDFASNDNPYFVITDTQCNLYEGSRPDGVVGPMYWEWLKDYDGYVAKLFMPIAQWKTGSDSNGDFWNVISRIHVTNNGEYDTYFKFLTTGGLYDHSRAIQYSTSFQVQTEEFDATYEAINDGVNVWDNSAQLTYSLSKNLFDISKVINVSHTDYSIINNNDGSITINTIRNSSVRPAGTPNKLSDYCPECEVGKTYTLSFVTSGTYDYIYLLNSGFAWGNGDSHVLTQSDLDSIVYWGASGNGTTANIYNIQLELGTVVTSFCPYGPTLDGSCFPIVLDNNLIVWDDDNIFNNIETVLKIPLYFKKYMTKECTPLPITLFGQTINLPCGTTLFWGREDVMEFRDTWNLLIGGPIVISLIIWFFRILTAVVDPTASAVGYGLDLIDVQHGKSELRDMHDARHKNQSQNKGSGE